jgi:hypothetical protein
VVAAALVAGAYAWAVPVGASSILNVPGSYATIQAAINAAVNGDTVMVAPGTYLENIDFKGKLITVQSAQGPSVTTIDGGGVAPVVNFSSAETSAAVLEGFTLQHGNATGTFGYEGAGVHINGASPTVAGNVITANTSCADGVGISVASASPVIRDNTITGNSKQPGCSGQWGGGIYVRGAASAQILHNTISNNSTDFGGGIGLFAAGTPTVQNNTITNNTATYGGGGIDLANQSDAAVVQNIIAGNSASNGGGVYLLTPSGTRGPLFVNNTIVGNTATDSGVYLSGFDSQVALYNNIVTASATQPAIECDTTYSSTSPLLDHNDVFNSAGPAVQGSCTSMMPNFSNISADPKFAAANDYHLATGSPAIDAGNNGAPSLPATDLDGHARISGVAVDQGVYEVQQTAPLTVAPASLPGEVEGATFATVLAHVAGGVSPYSANVAWGDGQSSAGTVGADNSVSGTHAYAEEGSYTVSVTVTDSTGASASATTPASVSDASIALAGAPRFNEHHKTNFTARLATLTDADPGGAATDFSGQINWGDRTVSTCPSATCSISASGSGFAVNGSHSYARNATYSVTVTLADAGGSSATTTTTIQVG